MSYPVAILSVDPEATGRGVARVAGMADAASAVVSDPISLRASDWGLVVVFADGLRAGPLRDVLAELSRRRHAPAVVIVTDEPSPRWQPSHHVRVVTSAAWEERAPAIVAELRDRSSRELPFTD